jgi:hypothetical protein
MPGHEPLLKGNRFPRQTKVYWPSVPLEGVSSRRLASKVRLTMRNLQIPSQFSCSAQLRTSFMPIGAALPAEV